MVELGRPARISHPGVSTRTNTVNTVEKRRKLSTSLLVARLRATYVVDGRFLGDLFWQVAGSAHTREFTYMLMHRDFWKVVGRTHTCESTVRIHVNSHTWESIPVWRLGAEPRKTWKFRKTSNLNKSGRESITPC